MTVLSLRIALLSVAGLVVLVGAAAASGVNVPAAVSHASDKAIEFASDHSPFHRGQAADARCDEFANHGAYVSSIAKAQHPNETNESDDQDDHEHANESWHKDGNWTHESRGHNDSRDGNETDETNETDDHEHSAVSDAARSDVGKCGGPKEGSDDGSDAEQADDSHGQSQAARDEHAPNEHAGEHPSSGQEHKTH